jgi:hypothetical protein
MDDPSPPTFSREDTGSQAIDDFALKPQDGIVRVEKIRTLAKGEIP